MPEDPLPPRSVPPPALTALWPALPLTAALLGLYYYWFAIADRYAIFLYNHMAAQPFDVRTVGRYWMTGLVAGGYTLLGYGIFTWYAARLTDLRGRRYTPPPWWQLWAACALPLAAGIYLITTTVNAPVLPPAKAALVVAAALPALALALYLGTLAAHALALLARLLSVGLGAALVLLFLHTVELPAHGFMAPDRAYALAAGSVAAGGVWLVAGAVVVGRRWPPLSASHLASGGLAWSYLLLPLAHHLLFTPPGFRYISAASNFFAYDLRVQVASLAVAGALVWLAARLGRRAHPKK